LVERYVGFCAILANQARRFWSKTEERLDCRAGFTPGPEFQHLSKEHQRVMTAAASKYTATSPSSPRKAAGKMAGKSAATTL